jgi:hypothetical protein
MALTLHLAGVSRPHPGRVIPADAQAPALLPDTPKLLIALVVDTVAHRRLRPSSSATTSTTEWALVSSAAQCRLLRSHPHTNWN